MSQPLLGPAMSMSKETHDSSVVPFRPTPAADMDDLVAQSTEELIRLFALEHEMAREAAGDLLVHSLRCGRLLNEIRNRHTEGTWYRWCAENLGVAYRLNRDYMYLARNEHIIDRLQPADKATALKLIRAEPDRILAPNIPYERSKPLTKDEIAYARELRADGMSWEDLGRTLSRSYRAVQRQMDPESAKRFNANRRKDRKRAAELRKIKAEEDRRELVRQAPTDISTVYGSLRRVLAMVDGARPSTATGRNRMAEAYQLLTEAEGKLVSAMKAERME